MKNVRLAEASANLNFKRAVSPQSVPPVAVSLPESVSIPVHDAHTSGSAPRLLLNLLTNM
jgi:hypothetical protein